MSYNLVTSPLHSPTRITQSIRIKYALPSLPLSQHYTICPPRIHALWLHPHSFSSSPSPISIRWPHQYAASLFKPLLPLLGWDASQKELILNSELSIQLILYILQGSGGPPDDNNIVLAQARSTVRTNHSYICPVHVTKEGDTQEGHVSNKYVRWSLISVIDSIDGA